MRGVLGTLAIMAGVLALAPSASALTWGAPVRVSASGELANTAAPATAMDATGDAAVAWTNYHDSSYDCPCQVRVALRAAGASFGAPITLASGDPVDVNVAMDAAGDTIVVWDNPVPAGSAGGSETRVYAAVRPAGGSFGTAQQLSINGKTADGGGVPYVAMDSSGDAIVAWISGLGWFNSDPEPQLMVVRRPAGASFSTPQAVATPHKSAGDNSGPWALRLAMSANGHAALAYTWQGPNTCTPQPCTPQGNTPENVEVTTAPTPAGQFGTSRAISPTVTWPGQGSGPAEDVQAVAIDNSGDVVASYNTTGAGQIFTASRRDEVATSDAGGAFSSHSLGAGGNSYADQVGIGPNRESVVTYTDANGLEATSRPLGGSFSAADPLSSANDGDTLAMNNNSIGASGTALEGIELNPGYTGSNESIVARLRQPGGVFGAATTVFKIPSGSYFDEGVISGAIDKTGANALLAWRQYTGGTYSDGSLGPVEVALASTPVTHTLTVSKSGSGSVTSAPTGISCGTVCSHAFTAGTSVTLSAHPASGYEFAGWSGACTGKTACTVSMSANKAVTATFTAIPPPNTVISAASISTANRTASFSFKGSGGVGTLHFECKLDSGSFASCTSPKAYSNLAAGSHKFEVEAIDSRGKVDPTPAIKSFSI